MLKIKNSYNVIGLMSGTSIDGVDLCYSNFSYENKNWKFLIRIAETVPYEKSWITKLTNAHALSDIELKKLASKGIKNLDVVCPSFVIDNTGLKFKIFEIVFIALGTRPPFTA